MWLGDYLSIILIHFMNIRYKQAKEESEQKNVQYEEKVKQLMKENTKLLLAIKLHKVE